MPIFVPYENIEESGQEELLLQGKIRAYLLPPGKAFREMPFTQRF